MTTVPVSYMMIIPITAGIIARASVPAMIHSDSNLVPEEVYDEQAEAHFHRGIYRPHNGL